MAESGDPDIIRKLEKKFKEDPEKQWRASELVKALAIDGVEKKDVNRCLQSLAESKKCVKVGKHWSAAGDGDSDGEGEKKKKKKKDKKDKDKDKEKSKDKKKRKRDEEAEEKATEATEGAEDEEVTDRVEGEILTVVTEDLLSHWKEQLESINSKLRALHKLYEQEGGCEASPEKATELLVEIGDYIVEKVAENVTEEDGNEPTVREVYDCVLEVIEDQEGKPPSVRTVRNKVTEKFQSLGRSKKEMAELIKTVWREVVVEYHAWVYLSMYCHHRHPIELKQMYNEVK